DHPSEAGLLLSDGLLTVADIVQLRLAGAELAYLSACETHRSVTLPDEAIHLASAFQLAGFRHVVATLWAISDLRSPQVAEIVYDELAASRRAGGGTALECADTAVALHCAVQELRDEHPDEPWLWA